MKTHKLLLILLCLFVSLHSATAEIRKLEEATQEFRNEYLNEEKPDNLFMFNYTLDGEIRYLPAKKLFVYTASSNYELRDVISFSYTGSKSYSKYDFIDYDVWRYSVESYDYEEMDTDPFWKLAKDSRENDDDYMAIIVYNDYSREEIVFDFSSPVVFKVTTVVLSKESSIREVFEKE